MDLSNDVLLQGALLGGPFDARVRGCGAGAVDRPAAAVMPYLQRLRFRCVAFGLARFRVCRAGTARFRVCRAGTARFRVCRAGTARFRVSWAGTGPLQGVAPPGASCLRRGGSGRPVWRGLDIESGSSKTRLAYSGPPCPASLRFSPSASACFCRCSAMTTPKLGSHRRPSTPSTPAAPSPVCRPVCPPVCRLRL